MLGKAGGLISERGRDDREAREAVLGLMDIISLSASSIAMLCSYGRSAGHPGNPVHALHEPNGQRRSQGDHVPSTHEAGRLSHQPDTITASSDVILRVRIVLK